MWLTVPAKYPTTDFIVNLNSVSSIWTHYNKKSDMHDLRLRITGDANGYRLFSGTEDDCIMVRDDIFVKMQTTGEADLYTLQGTRLVCEIDVNGNNREIR